MTQVQARERGDLKNPQNPTVVLTILRDSDHKPVCCNNIHFYVLIKPLFHTTGLPVCENTGNRKAFELFLSIKAEFNNTHYLR